MGFEVSKFGNGVAAGSGGNVTQNVHNFFGVRDSGETVGVFKTEGGGNEVTLNITGEQLKRDAVTDDGILVPTTIKGGFVISEVIARVTKPFVLGGTTPTILLGTDGSLATNGVVLSKAQAEAVGIYKLTPVGTWAAPINANTLLGIGLGGTTPTVTSAGEVDIIVKYTRP
jgi:hypothetical protein